MDDVYVDLIDIDVIFIVYYYYDFIEDVESNYVSIFIFLFFMVLYYMMILFIMNFYFIVLYCYWFYMYFFLYSLWNFMYLLEDIEFIFKIYMIFFKELEKCKFVIFVS